MIYPSFTIINTNAPVGENNGDYQDFHLGDLMMAMIVKMTFLLK